MKEITFPALIPTPQPQTTARPPAAGGFLETLTAAVGKVDQQQAAADQAMEKLATGEAKSLHEVLLTVEKADMSMRFFVQMRNKVIEAYQEISRLQV